MLHKQIGEADAKPVDRRAPSSAAFRRKRDVQFSTIKKRNVLSCRDFSERYVH
jgi:hypothetical protein